MASMMPAAHARTTDHPAESPAIRTEPLATLALQVQLATPADAPIGSAIITGGTAAGTALSGAVLPGSLEWSRDAARGITQLTLRYGLLTGSGDRLQMVDRASFPTAAGPAWARAITTSTELESMADPLADGGGLTAGLTIGRLDAASLDAGRLRLDLHRVL